MSGASAPPPGDSPAAVLTGPPGAGKSTVGRLLASALGTSFTDTDDIAERMAGKLVADIFVSDGEPAFREFERRAVAEALALPGVVALGGGAVMDTGIRDRLAGHRVVYLSTGFAAAAKRVGLDAPRPLLAVNPRSQLRDLLAERVGVYESVAWLTVVTDDREPAEIAAEIAAAVTAATGGQVGTGQL